jgi:hypothetical protein
MLADSQEAPATPAVHVRPAILLGVGALLNYAALEELLVDTRMWPFPAGAKLLFLLLAGLAARHVGRRIGWRPAATYLVISLGVLLALVAQW